ncbi:MAG: transcriptional regulator YeiL [Firmicutes bacterium]|nr:transcriptional regulator YeiL [Bacillota bacterium]
MKVKDPRKREQYMKKYPVHEYFSGKISQYLELHTFKEGEFICEERKAPDHLYFILEGKVKLSLIHQDGSVTLVQYYEPGDILGELELLGMRDQSQSIQAVGAVVCFALPIVQCKDILMSDVKFLQTLCRLVAGKMQRGVNKLVEMQSFSLENRLAAYLLQKEEEVGRGQWMQVKLTDLALYLGASYRHLSRVMKTFDEEGWIQKERTRIMVVQHSVLYTLAEQMKID